MTKSCCVPCCTNRYSKESKLKFFRLPKDPERRRLWIAAVNRKNWQPTEYSWICGQHFITKNKSKISTHPDYVPSIFRFGKSPQKKTTLAKCSLERYERAERMIAKRRRADKENAEPLHLTHQSKETGEPSHGAEDKENESLHLTNEGKETEEMLHGDSANAVCCLPEKQTENNACSSEPHIFEVGTHTDIITHAHASTQTDLVISTPTMIDVCTQVDDEFKQRTAQSVGVQTDKIMESVLFSDPYIKDDDEKVLFYTGLPNFATLLLVLEFVTSKLPASRGTLSSFQELFLVLMKLRLNLEEKDLAYRFGIHQSTVSRIFKKWTALMATQLSPLIRWPSMEEVRTTMPMAFRKFFSKCVCIIDCTELFIDRPSDLKVRAQTWSNYKQHNTVKFLISVTPQGTISFVSKAWGGRASDKYITEHCGILEHLLRGDLILADRGFTVQDSVGLYCAEK